ncbi:hypothetical protein J3E69DRAFT_65515 [Trichoderma sp. SZMC 28015]
MFERERVPNSAGRKKKRTKSPANATGGNGPWGVETLIQSYSLLNFCLQGSHSAIQASPPARSPAATGPEPPRYRRYRALPENCDSSAVLVSPSRQQQNRSTSPSQLLFSPCTHSTNLASSNSFCKPLLIHLVSSIDSLVVRDHAFALNLASQYAPVPWIRTSSHPRPGFARRLRSQQLFLPPIRPD